MKVRQVLMVTRAGRCPNLNHGRLKAPVHFCPMCGEVVNEKINIRTCSEEKHAERRRDRNKYCVDCGKQLKTESYGEHKVVNTSGILSVASRYKLDLPEEQIISISRIKSHKCPYRYYMEYIEKTKPSFESIEQGMGSYFHSYVENHFKRVKGFCKIDTEGVTRQRRVMRT